MVVRICRGRYEESSPFYSLPFMMDRIRADNNKRSKVTCVQSEELRALISPNNVQQINTQTPKKIERNDGRREKQKPKALPKKHKK